MDKLIEAIVALTAALPTPAEVAAAPEKPSARDWSAFFAVLVGLMEKILPLLLPIFLTPEKD